jgi:hypothetical protein
VTSHTFYHPLLPWRCMISNCMERSPWEPNSRSVWQEVSRLLWKQKVHYRVHKSPHLDRVPSQLNRVDTARACLLKIRFNIVLSSMSTFSERFLPFRLSNKSSYAFFISPFPATWPAHLILNLTILIFGEQYKLRSSSLCFMQPPVTLLLRSKYSA